MHSSQMGSTILLEKFLSASVVHSPKCHRNYGTLPVVPSQFLLSQSVLKLKKQYAVSTIQFKKLQNRSVHVYAAQSNFFKVLQSVWNVGKDGIEAGTNLVPDAVPRPIARLSVTAIAVTLTVFVLKSFLSTAFTVLATMGLIYFAFLALNKDDGPRGGGDGGATSAEDSLEEARRIMEKYK